MSRVKPQQHTEFRLTWQASLSDYITAIEWSGDGSLLAISSAAGEVCVWSFPEKQVVLTYQDPSSISTLKFSSDGSQLAAAGQRGEVIVWDLGTLERVLKLDPCEAWIDRLAWQPNSNILAFNANRDVHIININTQQTLAILDFVESSVLGLSWHPLGHYLAVCGHTGTKVWASHNWLTDPYLLRVPGASLAAAWSQDGTYLATGNYDRTLSVLEWGAPPPWLMQGFPGKVRHIQWSPQVSKNQPIPLLAAACVEGVTIWFQLDDSSGSWHSRVLQLHEGFVQSIAFRPNSCTLASADTLGVLGIWSEAKQLKQTLKGSRHGFSAITWDPQGIYLAAGEQDGGIKAWQEVNQSKKGFG